MSDYINREMAADCIVLECDNVTLERARQAIKDCPSADVVKTRHAEWQLIHKDKNFVKDIYQCSECRFLVTGTQEIAYVYCPNCGARMYHACYCSYGERKNDECE